MSFDSRSLQRLRELGRQLPAKLPDPNPTSTDQAKPQASRKRHRVETEQDPDALFRELMQASPDGTVPEHLMARLKQLELQRNPKSIQRATEQAIQSTELPLPPRERSGKGKTTRPQRRPSSPGSEEESLYVAFGQMLLEDEDTDS